MYTPTKRRSICFYHHWTLEHFRCFAQDQCPWKWRLCSNHFSPPNNAAFRFILTLEKVRDEATGEVYLAVGLGPVKVLKRARLEETTSVLNENGDTVYSASMAYRGGVVLTSLWDYIFNCFLHFLLAEHPAKELIIDSDHDKAFMMKKYLKISEFLDPTKDYLTRDGHLILYSAFTLTCPDLTDPKTTAPRMTHSNLLAPVAHFSHHFTIDHFSLLFRRADCCPFYLSSNYLAPKNEHLGKFYLRVYSKGISGADEEMLAIAYTNENTVALNVHCRMGLVDENGKEHFLFSNINMKQLPQWTVQTAVPRAEILDPASSFLLPEDRLIICCELHVMDDSQTISNIENLNLNKNATIPPTISSTSTVDIAQHQIYCGATVWKIEKFIKKKSKQSGSPLTSPLFAVGPYFGFSLVLNPKVKEVKGTDSKNKAKSYSTIALWSAKSTDEPTTIQYCIKIISSDGGEAICYTNQKTILAYGEYGRRRLLSRSAFKIMANYLVPNDTLTITCQIWLFTKRNCPIDRLYQQNHQQSRPTTSDAIFRNSTITNSIITTNGQLNMGNYTTAEGSRKSSIIESTKLIPKLRSLSMEAAVEYINIAQQIQPDMKYQVAKFIEENEKETCRLKEKNKAQLMNELIELL